MRSGLALRSVNVEAAALWRAPGQAHSAMTEFLRTVIPLLATFGPALPRGLKVQGCIDAHRHKGRFWYLLSVGVGPGDQGKVVDVRVIPPQTRVPGAEGRPGWRGHA